MKKIGKVLLYGAIIGGSYFAGKSSTEKHEQYRVFDSENKTYIMDKQMNVSVPIRTIDTEIYAGDASHNLKGAFVLTGENIKGTRSKSVTFAKDSYQSLENKANTLYQGMKEKFKGN